jgi:oligosaccharide reducing-end xylanase
MDQNAASDGETFFVTSLLFATARWGDNTGRFNYTTEALLIMHAMLHKEDGPQRDSVTNMFNKNQAQVVFVPVAQAATYTDPSYHTPAFYTIWANESAEFWNTTINAARKYFAAATHTTPGLSLDYSGFGGTPYGGGQNFGYDAWRTSRNIAVDYAWLAHTHVL